MTGSTSSSLPAAATGDGAADGDVGAVMDPLCVTDPGSAGGG